MSEKPNDGTVALYIGDIENNEYMAAEEGLPILPNAHTADMLAAHSCKLMAREGNYVDDHVQINPVPGNRSSSNQLGAPGICPSSVSPKQQYSEGVSSQPSNVIAKHSNTTNITASSPQNMQGLRMMSPANAQALQISQGMNPGVSMPPRPQQLVPLSFSQQQQQQNQTMLMQQQHLQLERTAMMLSANQMSHLDTMAQKVNTQMANNHSPLQLQMLQQQAQQLRQHQARRKMMMSLGNLGGISNMGNGMAGLRGAMTMGAVRGVGTTGSISRMGNVAQSPVNQSQASNIGNAIRSGLFTSAEAALMTEKLEIASAQQAAMIGRMRMARLINQQYVTGGTGGATQQVHGGAAVMLNPTLNRGTLNPIQQTGIGRMRPPMMMSGMKVYTPQQQQQLHIQQQQMQLHLQQQEHLQQQQQQDKPQAIQTVTSLQGDLPSNMGLPQQMNQQFQQQQLLQQASPQQMSQRTHN